MTHSHLTHFNPLTGAIDGAAMTVRRLSDLAGAFADRAAYRRALEVDDPIVYTVATVTPDHGDGALHYASARIMPGRIGDEYYLTRGHLHRRRSAAEYYIGLSGTGVMLLQDEDGGNSRMLALTPHSALYVPGHTAHRTVNTGNAPLVYLGIYPSDAGHDYGALAEQNFSHVVVARHGETVYMEREMFLEMLQRDA